MIPVLIATDSRIYRDGLALALCNCPHVAVAGTAASAAEAIDAIPTFNPAVVFLDVAMPGAVDVARFTRGYSSEPKIVAVSLIEEDAEIVAWAKVGIAGFLNRNASVDDLVRSAVSAVHGDLRCSPRAAGVLLRQVAAQARTKDQSTSAESLTRQQLRVLELINRGLSNKEIAASLGIEVATVKNHVHALLQKLRVKRRGEAAALARRAVMAPTTLFGGP